MSTPFGLGDILFLPGSSVRLSVRPSVRLFVTKSFPLCNLKTVYSYFMLVWGIVETAAPRCRGQFDALLPEAERPISMVHRAVHGTEEQ